MKPIPVHLAAFQKAFEDAVVFPLGEEVGERVTAFPEISPEPEADPFAPTVRAPEAEPPSEDAPEVREEDVDTIPIDPSIRVKLRAMSAVAKDAVAACTRCGRRYTAAEWLTLDRKGLQPDGRGGTHELRNCPEPCSSTHAVPYTAPPSDWGTLPKTLPPPAPNSETEGDKK